MFIFERGRESVCAGEGQRDRETEDPCAVLTTEPDAGLEPMNPDIMTLNQQSHPGAPPSHFINVAPRKI